MQSSKRKENSKYKEMEYWNNRYLEEKSYEWCKSYKWFKHLINENISKESKILILGCGNSSLSEDMYNDGFKDITNIDYSSVVLQNISSQCKSTTMEWIVMDIRKLLFVPESFDVILEKATLDSLLVDEVDPWRVSKQAQTLMKEILMQISSLLVEGGKFLSLTFAQPHFRKKLLCKNSYRWSVRHCTYGEGFYFFFYVMTKGEALDREEPDDEAVPKAKQKSFPNQEEEDDFICRLSLDL